MRVCLPEYSAPVRRERRRKQHDVESSRDEASAESAFNAVYAREKTRLFRLAYAIVRDAPEAEDAVQETMWQAWSHWRQLREEERRTAWLTRICVNQCIRRRQRLLRWRRGQEHLVGEAEAPAPDLPPELERLDEVFRELSSQQRAAVVLRYGYGYSVEECAVHMGCGPGTVHTHVSRALATLRRRLGDD